MDHFWTYISTIALMAIGFLLMFIILLQRGRGGGLAGAFGGLGGQSAFGTKAGDVFTKITIVLAVVWVTLAGLSGFAMRSESKQAKQFVGGSEGSTLKPIETDQNESQSSSNTILDDDSVDKVEQETDPLDKNDQSKTGTKKQPSSDESKSKDDPETSSKDEADKSDDKKQDTDSKKQPDLKETDTNKQPSSDKSKSKGEPNSSSDTKPDKADKKKQ